MLAVQAAPMHDSIFRSAALFIPLALAACGSSSGDDTGSGATDTAVPTATVTLGDSDPSSGTATTTPTTDAPTTTSDGSATDAATTTASSTGSETGDPTDATTEPATTTTTTGDDTGTTTDTDTTTGNGLWDRPNLWYAAGSALVYIEIDPMDGSVVQLIKNELVADVPLWNGQNGLTMLEDGSLLGSRESEDGTQIYHIAEPPITADTPATATFLGLVPGDQQGEPGPRVEALYTDCDGRIYLMDTGVDVGNSDGNRLLRFNAGYLKGELGFDVITDLGDASVGDIDDMSPGLVDGEISDGLGFAMDSGDLWKIDYTTGTGMKLAETAGSWGIHALGGPLFGDLTARLYILSNDAKLFEVHLDNFKSDAALIVGPDIDDSAYNGWSGLAGPLTECMSTIPQ